MFLQTKLFIDHCREKKKKPSFSSKGLACLTWWCCRESSAFLPFGGGRMHRSSPPKLLYVEASLQLSFVSFFVSLETMTSVLRDLMYYCSLFLSWFLCTFLCSSRFACRVSLLFVMSVCALPVPFQPLLPSSLLTV